MKNHNYPEAFLELVRAGLWSDGNPDIRIDGTTDWQVVYRLAAEQSVLGLVLAGLEHSDIKPPKELLLLWIGAVQMIEQQNKAMNGFIADIVEKMRDAGIYSLIVKGQGVAQCYERPLWRSSGDVDILLSDDNYVKAKKYLIPIADSVETESGKHQGMTLGQWVVELHGNLHCGLSTRMDKVIDDVQKDVFSRGNVRSWMNGRTQVFLPSPENDSIFIFTHFLKHFYKGGLGMRQICDWCRLLWTYRESIDYHILEHRLKEMRLTSEWKSFGAYAVEYLGMPTEAMPLYENKMKWKKKARRINIFVMAVGNMGHNREKEHKGRRSFIVRKIVSFDRRIMDFFNHVMIFPFDSLRFFLNIVFNGIRLAAKGIG